MFDAARAELGDLPVVAEDLGVITPDVRELRDALGFPGMAVTIWAFSGGRDNPHRLENHRPHQVVYTSTHDTETLAGAFGERDAWQLVELDARRPSASSRSSPCRTCSVSGTRPG